VAGQEAGGWEEFSESKTLKLPLEEVTAVAMFSVLFSFTVSFPIPWNFLV